MVEMTCKDILNFLKTKPEVLTYLGLLQIIVFAFVRFIFIGITQAVLYHVSVQKSGLPYCSCYAELFEKHSLGFYMFLHGITIVTVWFGYLLYSELKYRWHKDQILRNRSRNPRIRNNLIWCYKGQIVLRIAAEVIFVIIQSELFGFKVHTKYTCGYITRGQFTNGSSDVNNNSLWNCTVPNASAKSDFLLAMLIVSLMSIVFAILELGRMVLMNNDQLFPALFHDFSTSSQPSLEIDGDIPLEEKANKGLSNPIISVCLLPKPVRYFHSTHYMDKLKFRYQKNNIVALAGEPGCGKTQLALKFGHDIIQSHDVALAAVIYCDSTWTIIHSLRLIRHRFNLSTKEQLNKDNEVGDTELETLLRETISALIRKFNAVFLLFDNVQENGYIIELVCTPRENFLALITTNDASVFRDCNLVMNMSGFTDQEAVAFIKREAGVFTNFKESDIIKLSKAVNNLPFGVAIVRSYLSKLEGSIDIDNYIDSLLEGPKQTSRHLPQHMNTNANKQLLRAIQISIEDLNRGLFHQSNNSFQLVAFLYGFQLSLNLLQDLLGDSLQDFLLELKYMCLGNKANVDGISLFSVHPVVQTAILYQMSPTQQNQSLKEVLVMLKHHLDKSDTTYADYYSFNINLVPNVYSVLNYLSWKEEFIDGETRVGKILLLNSVGKVYIQRGLVDQALIVLKEAKSKIYALMQTSEAHINNDIVKQVRAHRRQDDDYDEIFFKLKAEVVMAKLETVSVNNLGATGVLNLACYGADKENFLEFLEGEEDDAIESSVTASKCLKLTPVLYEQLMSHKAALPINKLSVIFLSELFAHVLYLSGHLYSYLNVLQSKMYANEKTNLIQDLKLAKRIIQTIYDRYDIPLSLLVLIDRDILLALNFEPNRKSREEYVLALEYTRDVYLKLLEDERDYYELGLLSISDLCNDPYHNALCQRELLHCYIVLVQLEYFEVTNCQELMTSGQQHCNTMLRILIRELQDRKIIHKLSTFYNMAAKFLLLYDDDDHREKALQYYMDSYVIETSSDKVNFALFDTLLGLINIYRQEGKNHEAMEYSRECVQYAKVNYMGPVRYREDAERVMRQIRCEESYSDCDTSRYTTHSSLNSTRDYQNLLSFA